MFAFVTTAAHTRLVSRAVLENQCGCLRAEEDQSAQEVRLDARRCDRLTAACVCAQVEKTGTAVFTPQSSTVRTITFI